MVVLQGPSSGSVNKEVGAFTKGQVQLSASVDRNLCSPGKLVPLVLKTITK